MQQSETQLLTRPGSFKTCALSTLSDARVHVALGCHHHQMSVQARRWVRLRALCLVYTCRNMTVQSPTPRRHYDSTSRLFCRTDCYIRFGAPVSAPKN